MVKALTHPWLLYDDPTLAHQAQSTRLGRTLVHRPALVQRINQGLEGYLTLVSAPVGFGKTTLASEWAAQSPRRIAWLSLDESDNDLDVFVSYCIAAIRTIFPEACPDLSELIRSGQLPEVTTLSSIFINEIDDLPDRFVLILDDYHCITTRAIHDLLDHILRHPPLPLHLLMTSRTDPPLALSRLRSNGLLTEFRANDLHFSPQETEVFLAQTVGVDQSEQAAAVLQTRSEGWIAGLQLAATSLRMASDKPAFIKELAYGQNRQIMTYLFEQVLQQQSLPVRDFLIKTSIVDRFSAALARAIVGAGPDAPALVTPLALEQAGLMLNALDSTGEWYAYHALFRDLLRQTLQSTCPPEELAQLHRRAALWLSQQNLIEEALHQALAAHDMELATQIIAANWIEQLNREDWRTVERWLSLLPDDVIATHHWLVAAKLAIFQVQYRWDGLLPLLKQAEQLMAEATILSGTDRLLLRGHLDWIWAFYWLVLGEADRAKEVAQQALLNLPQTHAFAFGSALVILAAALQWLDEFESANRMLESILALTPSTPSNPARPVNVLFALMNLQMAEGYMDQGAQTARLLLSVSSAAHATITPVWARLALGVAAYEANDLEQAAHHFRAGIELRLAGNPRAGHECLNGLALTNQAQGRLDEVQGVLAIMLDDQSVLMHPALNADSQSLRSRLAVLSGDVPTARKWVDATGSDRGLLLGWLEVPILTRIQVELADLPGGDLSFARREIDRLLELVTRLRQPRRQVQLLLFKALLCDRLGDRTAAVQHLRAALTLAEPRGLIRTFVDAGPGIEPLLKSVAAECPTPYLTHCWPFCVRRNNCPLNLKCS